mmetsp:Transcript_20789/g.30787  ORF Transcript_20789/g.30787 Transcript_20789/m.30787 type:complete len:465 (-) Transcript_20789:26-1420(-)|eukprot:CAMPEP_0171461526 /NCGR_PEP_ID=MMETSP0945-20130129/5938_1 /TAXON_ID=109269 /ORGANISM="Vaucheria litorea, Strain CCMP2940" /LENGTH=464 /DNA_ID=CAMNT_0011987889 /DNA_START=127 /DNA_END=1521 /DNA_ORIENTATION=+
MKGLFVAVSAVLAAAVSGEYVVNLGDSDFDAHLAEKKFVLAEFYAPWCGHCKALAPEYEKAAEQLAGEEIEGGLSLVAVDATENKDLASKFEVQGFPTLKWFVDGEPSEYSGGRTKDEIVAWINKKTGPPAKDIADDAALTNFKDSADVTVFGYFSSTDSDAAKAYVAAAQTMDEAQFGMSTTVSAGLDADTVVVFRNFEGEEPEVKCEGELTKDSIKKCVSGNLLPLIVPFSQQNAPKIFGGEIKQHLLAFIDSSDSSSADNVAKLRPVASANKGEYLFVTVDKTDDRILEFFGISAENLPTARIVEMLDSGMKKYALEGDFSEEGLKSFVASHSAGELKQALKSEDDIPDEEQPKEGNQYILVGKNFDRVIAKEGAVKLVEFYAPWCGHCKKLAPEYEKLADHYAEDDGVIIAKMDSTANEVDSVQIQGFPTLKFFKGDEVLDFDGSRDFDGMKDFIEKNRN